MPTEIWKPVPSLPLLASSFGNISSINRVTSHGHTRKGKVLSQIGRAYGHKVISTTIDGIKKTLYVHRLVLMAFQGMPPDDMEACHRNGNASDNNPDNLYWSTHADNMADGVKHGTSCKGERQGRRKLTENQVKIIRKSTQSNQIIANEYGIHPNHVRAIKRKQYWNHIN